MPDEPTPATEQNQMETLLAKHMERMQRIHQEELESTEALCDLNIIMIHTQASAVVSERERKLADALIDKITK